MERGLAAEGPGVVLARRAVDEVSAMVERVGEVERMMRRGEFPQALEHAAWLATEYPQHANPDHNPNPNPDITLTPTLT